MPAPDWRRLCREAATDCSSPLLLSLLREPFVDAGEVGVIVVVVEASECRPALHLVGHVGPVEALDELDQLFKCVACQACRCRISRSALLASVVSPGGFDVANRLNRALAEVGKAAALSNRRFERKLRRKQRVDVLWDRHAPGLVVVDHDRTVLADVDAVGAGSQPKAWRDWKVKRAIDLRAGAGSESPPRGLSRREPAGELLEGRPPEGFDPRRAAKLGEGLVGDSDELGEDVGG